jgi:hypothetical protein
MFNCILGHTWQLVDKFEESLHGKLIGLICVDRCVICGKIKKTHIKLQ